MAVSDQSSVVSRMLAVLDAAQAGRDLEQPPQSVTTLPLDEALERLTQLAPDTEP